MTSILNMGLWWLYAERLVITHLVLLVTLGGSDHKMVNGAPIFNENRCEGNSEITKEFKIL